MLRRTAAALVFLLAAATGGMAQQPQAQPQSQSKAQSKAQGAPAVEDLLAIDRVISILENDAERQRLTQELKALQSGLRQADSQGGATPAAAPSGTPAPAADATATPSGEAATPANGEAALAATETPAEDAILTETGLMGAVSGWMGDVAEGLPNAALGAPIGVRLEQAQSQLSSRLTQEDVEHTVGMFFARASAGWVAALLGWYIVQRLMRRGVAKRLEKAAVVPPGGRAITFVMVAAFLPAIAAFAAMIGVAAAVHVTVRNAQLAVLLASPIILACFAQRLLAFALGLLRRTRGRRLTEYARRRLKPWIMTIVGLATLSSVVLAPATQFTIGWATAALISLCLDMVVAIVSLMFVSSHRRTMRSLIVKRGHKGEVVTDSAIERVITRLGNSWHLLGYAFISLNIIARVLGTGSGSFVTQAIVSVVVVAVSLMAMSTAEKRFEEHARRARLKWRITTRQLIMVRAARLVQWVLQVVIVVAAAAICLSLWGLNLFSWMQSTEGLAVITPLLSIAVAVMTAWLIWISLDAWIQVTLSHKDGASASWNRSARVQTLLPLLRNFAFVVLTVLTFIAVLANLGINVAPLLAGAGVVGLAIGFGSQQLVADVITGLFFLLEDTLAIGDVVNTGDRAGTVEALTIRTVKIRDGDGALHSVPFSSIKALKNSSRDFGVYFVNLTIDPKADVAKAIEALKEAGQEVQQDPRFTSVILQPLDVWGVDQITPDGILIKGAIRTRPLQQWAVGRAINLLAKEKLDELGVDLASRMLPPMPVAKLA